MILLLVIHTGTSVQQNEMSYSGPRGCKLEISLLFCFGVWPYKEVKLTSIHSSWVRTKQYMADEEWNFDCVFLPEEVANARVSLGLPGGRLQVTTFQVFHSLCTLLTVCSCWLPASALMMMVDFTFEKRWGANRFGVEEPPFRSWPLLEVHRAHACFEPWPGSRLHGSMGAGTFGERPIVGYISAPWLIAISSLQSVGTGILV